MTREAEERVFTGGLLLPPAAAIAPDLGAPGISTAPGEPSGSGDPVR